jgi:hypothetical protein
MQEPFLAAAELCRNRARPSAGLDPERRSHARRRRHVYALLAEGKITDDAAQAAAEAVQARRRALADGPCRTTTRPPRPLAGFLGPSRVSSEKSAFSCQTDPLTDGETPKAIPGPHKGDRTVWKRREKMFGLGRPRALDRNAKVRIMHWARCLSRRTEKGRAYGVVSAKALAVLEALLWAFHNAKSGLCFPSYEKIAEAAGCARSTVAEAIKALEDAGVLSWVQRIKRVRERCSDLLGDNGWRWRVLRTSNAYNFRDPSAPSPLAGEGGIPSKSEKPPRTPNQVFPFLSAASRNATEPPSEAAINRRKGLREGLRLA